MPVFQIGSEGEGFLQEWEGEQLQEENEGVLLVLMSQGKNWYRCKYLSNALAVYGGATSKECLSFSVGSRNVCSPVSFANTCLEYNAVLGPDQELFLPVQTFQRFEE